MSSPSSVSSAVPQGTVLDPLILCFISPPGHIGFSNIIYADDIALYNITESAAANDLEPFNVI